MDKTVVIYLIHEKTEYDDIGQPVGLEVVRRKTYAQKKSVTRSEWFEAGRVGMNPVSVFVVRQIDYADEETVEFDGANYGVYRTYETTRGDKIELYCERKGGI